MSNIFFISDTHLGHKNILKFSPERGGTNITEHSEWLVEQWNSVVRPQDLVWMLGDICFDMDHLHYLDYMNGKKNLILGNHDEFELFIYQDYFEYIGAFKRKYKFWMSHAPIHPNHLRGIPNVHGHLHSNVVMRDYFDGFQVAGEVPDEEYFNVSVERLNGVPIELNELRKKLLI